MGSSFMGNPAKKWSLDKLVKINSNLYSTALATPCFANNLALGCSSGFGGSGSLFLSWWASKGGMKVNRTQDPLYEGSCLGLPTYLHPAFGA